MNLSRLAGSEFATPTTKQPTDWRSLISEWIPAPLKPSVRRVAHSGRRLVARVRSAVGVKPLSEVWGADRGIPIHRYYLTQFLREFRADIQGHCLEFLADTYVTAIGGNAVTKVDVLHVDDSNPRATIVADLTRSNGLAAEQFDCIVCTHVLHLVTDFNKVTAEMHRLLKPGGVLLVAVPQISMCDPGWHEFWRFTPEGLALLLGRVFGTSNVLVRSYGNSLASACEIRGLASEDVNSSVLDYHDPRFAVEVCARATKSADSVAGGN